MYSNLCYSANMAFPKAGLYYKISSFLVIYCIELETFANKNLQQGNHLDPNSNII